MYTVRDFSFALSRTRDDIPLHRCRRPLLGSGLVLAYTPIQHHSSTADAAWSRMYGSSPLALRARTHPKPKRARELRSRKRLWARTPRPPASMLIQCAHGLENKNLTQHASAEMALRRTMPLAWARLSVYGSSSVSAVVRQLWNRIGLLVLIVRTGF